MNSIPLTWIFGCGSVHCLRIHLSKHERIQSHAISWEDPDMEVGALSNSRQPRFFAEIDLSTANDRFIILSNVLMYNRDNGSDLFKKKNIMG